MNEARANNGAHIKKKLHDRSLAELAGVICQGSEKARESAAYLLYRKVRDQTGTAEALDHGPWGDDTAAEILSMFLCDSSTSRDKDHLSTVLSAMLLLLASGASKPGDLQAALVQCARKSHTIHTVIYGVDDADKSDFPILPKDQGNMAHLMGDHGQLFDMVLLVFGGKYMSGQRSLRQGSQEIIQKWMGQTRALDGKSPLLMMWQQYQQERSKLDEYPSNPNDLLFIRPLLQHTTNITVEFLKQGGGLGVADHAGDSIASIMGQCHLSGDFFTSQGDDRPLLESALTQAKLQAHTPVAIAGRKTRL